MCNVREGADVRTKGDLQNLITSVILRQTSTFSFADIYQAANRKLAGSEYQNRQEIEKRCKDTISALYLMDCLKSEGKGQYSLAMSFPSVNKL